MNEARLRLTRIPKGADLILNKVSGAPGFWIDNVKARVACSASASTPGMALRCVARITALLNDGDISNVGGGHGCLDRLCRTA